MDRNKRAVNDHFIFGKNRRDIALMIDFTRKRALLRTNTAFIDGIALEEIPLGMNGYKPGMALIRRGWDRIYFLMERTTWTEDDYFRYADRRIDELNIERP